MTELEEEAGCFRDHTAKKRAHMYHPSVMYCSWPFGEVARNSPRVAHIFQWDESCVVHNSLIVARIFLWDESRVAASPRTPYIRFSILIGSSQRLRLRAARKLLAIVLESPYTRFLSGPPNDPTSIHKSGSKFG
jgi:hypothetical protein